MDTLDSFRLRDLIEPLALGLITGAVGLLFVGAALAGLIVIGIVAVVGTVQYISARCERSNAIQRTAVQYWCVTCRKGTEHNGNKCLRCDFIERAQ